MNNITRFVALSIVRQGVVAGLDKKHISESFVSVLARFKSLYHFDEDASEICRIDDYGKNLFSKEEAELCNSIRDYCYGEYLFELAINVMHGEEA